MEKNGNSMWGRGRVRRGKKNEQESTVCRDLIKMR